MHRVLYFLPAKIPGMERKLSVLIQDVQIKVVNFYSIGLFLPPCESIVDSFFYDT